MITPLAFLKCRARLAPLASLRGVGIGAALPGGSAVEPSSLVASSAAVVPGRARMGAGEHARRAG